VTDHQTDDFLAIDDYLQPERDMTDTQSPTADEQLAPVLAHTRKFFIAGEWVQPHSS
jgi:hypothetical protein